MAELQSVSSDNDALRLAKIGTYLGRLPQPTRTPRSHKAGWKQLERRIAAENKASGRSFDVRNHLSRLLQNWKYAAVPAFACALLVSGVVILSQHSLPGGTLYGVKRASENAKFALAFTTKSKAENCSKQMRSRAQELATLSSGSSGSPGSSGKISTATVRQLTNEITQEANEFDDYAKQSNGATRADLMAMRIRDIDFTLKQLDQASAHLHDNSQQSILTATHNALAGNIEA